MRRSIIGFAVLGVVGLSAMGVGALKEADSARLERIKATRETEISKAAERYQKAVDDANQKAKAFYNGLIQQYTRSGDAETAAQLQTELDAMLAADTAPGATTASDADAPKDLNRDLIRMIGPMMLRADGTRVDTRQLGSVPHVLLYFSASWCGPCKKFTPSLVEFFNEVAADRKVMVVLVGSDRSEMDQMNYMKESKMPWVAVPFNRIQASGLQSKYGGKGIPNLVLLSPDGTVVSGSYVDGRYVGPSKVLADTRRLLAETQAEAPAEKTE